MNAAGVVSVSARRNDRTPVASWTTLLFLLLMAARVANVSGGLCWESIERNGKCKELMAQHVSRESCCSSGGGGLSAAAYSPDDLEQGALFFWRSLGGGLPCAPCRETCSGVQCGPGRSCRMRRGRPRCVCTPNCSATNGRGGPVCGTDGRTYRNLCRLKKRACRRRLRDLTVNYYGQCQSSCERVKCGSGRHCLLDRDERAHCVRCSRTCLRGGDHNHHHHRQHHHNQANKQQQQQHQHDQSYSVSKALCGVDGVTYQSACHLRAAACRAGRSLPMAYRGPCTPDATCSSVKCKSRQQCLVDPATRAPRCVTCGARCPRAPRPRRALCANNNRTYTSWCHMVQDACATGLVIDTKHVGECKPVILKDNVNNIHEEDKDEENFDLFP